MCIDQAVCTVYPVLYNRSRSTRPPPTICTRPSTHGLISVRFIHACGGMDDASTTIANKRKGEEAQALALDAERDNKGRLAACSSARLGRWLLRRGGASSVVGFANAQTRSGLCAQAPATSLVVGPSRKPPVSLTHSTQHSGPHVTNIGLTRLQFATLPCVFTCVNALVPTMLVEQPRDAQDFQGWGVLGRTRKRRKK